MANPLYVELLQAIDAFVEHAPAGECAICSRALASVEYAHETCCPAFPALIALEEVLDRVFVELDRDVEVKVTGDAQAPMTSEAAGSGGAVAVRIEARRREPRVDAAVARYGGMFDITVAAQILGITEGAVRSRIHRKVLVPDGRGPRGVALFRQETLEAQLRGRSSSYIPGRAAPRDIDEVFDDGATSKRKEHALSGRAADRGRTVPAPSSVHGDPHAVLRRDLTTPLVERALEELRDTASESGAPAPPPPPPPPPPSDIDRAFARELARRVGLHVRARR